MAENKTKRKSRLSEPIILIFVAITAILLAVQLGMNVIAQTQDDTARQATIIPRATATPEFTPGPSPTFDYSAPVGEDAS